MVREYEIRSPWKPYVKPNTLIYIHKKTGIKPVTIKRYVTCEGRYTKQFRKFLELCNHLGVKDPGAMLNQCLAEEGWTFEKEALGLWKERDQIHTVLSQIQECLHAAHTLALNAEYSDDTTLAVHYAVEALRKVRGGDRASILAALEHMDNTIEHLKEVEQAHLALTALRGKLATYLPE